MSAFYFNDMPYDSRLAYSTEGRAIGCSQCGEHLRWGDEQLICPSGCDCEDDSCSESQVPERGLQVTAIAEVA